MTLTEINFDFEAIWDAVKWAILIVVWPATKWIADRITGKRQRKLDAIDELLERVSDQAIKIGKLIHVNTEFRMTEATLKQEIAELRAELVEFRKSQEKISKLYTEIKSLKSEIATLNSEKDSN